MTVPNFGCSGSIFCTAALQSKSAALLAAFLSASLVACGKSGKNCTQDSDCGLGAACSEVLKVCISPVENPPLILTSSLPEGVVGHPYQYALSVDGGTSPLHWMLSQRGAQVAWLRVDGDSGELSGTPGATASEVPVSARVVDSANRADEKALFLSVRTCSPGETFDCMVAVNLACYHGKETCGPGGELMACLARAGSPSGNLSTCGASCSACSTGADRCVEGVCKCGSADACASSAPRCCGIPDGGLGCVDVLKDPDFCGSCNNACDVGRIHVVRGCDGGACEYPCEPGWGRCPAGSPNPSCDTNIQTTENCGGCGRRCSAPIAGYATCDGRSCQMACYGTDRLCGNVCRAIDDVNHCGGCNQVCTVVGGTASCPGGNCTADCPSGYRACGSGQKYACYEDNDPRHCGDCTTHCSSDEICSDGICVRSCVPHCGP